MEWDPYSIPILTEIGGSIAFGDIVEGVTMREEVDEVTGLSRKVVIDSPDQNLRPRISIKDAGGKTARLPASNAVARYLLPAGAHILVNKGDEIFPGDILVKIPRETTKTKDITGGLPRVVQVSRRAEMVRSLATVAVVSLLPSPPILRDFETIRALSQSPPADEQLLALLQ